MSSPKAQPVCGDEVEMELVFDGERLPVSATIAGAAHQPGFGFDDVELVEGKAISEIRRLSDEFTRMMTEPNGSVPEDLGDLEALRARRKFRLE